MAVSESNSEAILSGTFQHAINTYLQKDESEDAMLKKFNGDKTELVKFLRDRDYKEWIKTNKKPADTSDIKNKIHDLKKQHEKDVADGNLRLYDTPRVKETVNTPTSPPLPSKSKSAPAKSVELEAPKVEVKKEEKPIVKYVEPPVMKKKWSKKKEKPESDKNQSSLF
jgi:hypothetical protein